MKIEWAKYLMDNSDYQKITNDTNYIEIWKNYIMQHAKAFPAGQLVTLTGNLTIQEKAMFLEFVLYNATEKSVTEVELEVELSVLGKPYFKGVLRTNKDCYQVIEPGNARLDLVDFGNDRYEDGVYSAKDYELKVLSCKEIEYTEGVEEI